MGAVTITGLIAVRDGAEHLAEAVDSVLAEPEITDVVVVDDGSTDATPQVLAGFGDRIRIVRQSPRGQFAALNLCVAEATGELIAIQDADDVWPPGRTKALVAALADDLDGVFGWVEQFVSPELEPSERARLRVDARPQPSYLLQTLLLRRDAFWRIGPLDESMATSSNIDWISRARSGGLRTTMIPVVVTRRRIHRSNTGRRDGDRRDADLLRVVRAHLQRQRRTDLGR
jgi:glycosyltransferase involved in cell wall biosynthesis